MSLITKFLFDDRSAIVMQTPHIPRDDEALARIQAKAEQAKAYLGERFALHPKNQIKRKS